MFTIGGSIDNTYADTYTITVHVYDYAFILFEMYHRSKVCL
jgi:hypothetical protein